MAATDEPRGEASRGAPFRPTRWLRVRMGAAVLLVTCAFGLIGYRAYVLQVRESASLRTMAQDQYLREVEIPPRRGRILDRNGVVLAASAEVDSVACNQRVVDAHAVEIARALAGPLHLDRREIEKHLRGKHSFTWIKRRIDPDEARAVRELALPGISLLREPRRYYPNRDLAGPILGWAGLDAVGQEGLELEFDRYLRGTRAEVPGLRDALGRAVLIGGLGETPPSLGHDVETTLDRHIQFRLEGALARAVAAHHAKAATAVAIDPRNGELLAVASLPTFDPNEPSDAAERGARLRAVTDSFEPGSTMKTFAIAGALEAGLVRPDEPFYCENGSYKVGPVIIHDAERVGDVTLTGVLAKSSNICAAKIAAREGKERMRAMMLRFGFGRPTGVDLPGERAGNIKSLAHMGPVETATTSFGQGMTATAMQIAAAYAAIANGGTLLRPHVLRRVVDDDGNVTSEAGAEGHRVIDASLAATLRTMLYAVTQKGGTAEKLSLPGYRFAGKTGTAQKVDSATRQYSKWVSSFVGFAPLDDPRIVLYVMLDEPQGSHYGSEVAGPTFEEVVGDALRWMGVRPTETAPLADAHPRAAAKVAPRAAPVHAAPVVELAVPPSPDDAADDDDHAPELRGLSLAAVIARAARLGVRLKVSGSGLAVDQNPAPGASLDDGVLRVSFRPPG